ncbi:MAG: hypothetical protein KGP28_10860 [Bdellovibrionales bacterium]|nr:hypothetical protein [Bdellovibrionales bacterium]
MMGLILICTSCSLEQQSQESQIRIRIDPSVIRRIDSGRFNAQDLYPSLSLDSEGPPGPTVVLDSLTKLLINVEGPGIPYINVPGLPCIRLGIGTSVLLPMPPTSAAGSSSPSVPIEILVPSGLNRKVVLYEINYSQNVPSSGISASQYFLGAGSSGLGVESFEPSVHAAVTIPSLFSEQTIELMRVTSPGPVSCDANSSFGPPVLPLNQVGNNVALFLSNYRPYQRGGESVFQSGKIEMWKPSLPTGSATVPWIFRVSGKLGSNGGNIGEAVLSDLILASPSPTPIPTPNKIFSSLASPTPSPSPSPLVWFQENYSLAVVDANSVGVLNHRVSVGTRAGAPSVIRNIPYQYFDGVPVFLDQANSLNLVALHNNLYSAVVNPVTTDPIQIEPIQLDSVFVTDSSARLMVVPPPPDQSESPPPCPLRFGGGDLPSMFTLGPNGCKLYFTNKDGISLGGQSQLVIELRAKSAGSGFRWAQLRTESITQSLLAYPEIESTFNPNSSPIALPFPYANPPQDPSIIMVEVVSSSGIQRYFAPQNGIGIDIGNNKFNLNNPPSCTAEVRILVRGKFNNGSTQFSYRWMKYSRDKRDGDTCTSINGAGAGGSS